MDKSRLKLVYSCHVFMKTHVLWVTGSVRVIDVNSFSCVQQPQTDHHSEPVRL